MTLPKLSPQRGLLFLSIAGMLAAGPAAADCLDEVAALERRVAQLEKRFEGKDKPGNAGGTVAAPGATESWFGSPPSLEGAREQLHNARMLGKEGDEDSCRSHLDQARRIVDNVRR